MYISLHEFLNEPVQTPTILKMKFTVATAFLLITQVLCYEDPKISDLPAGAAKEVFSILSKKNDLLQGTCGEPNPDDIELMLYTRRTRDNPTILDHDDPSEIDTNKRLVLVIHGWSAGSQAYGIQEVKNAILMGHDYNVIVVNWKPLAWKLYTESVCYLPKIAKLVAKFLCNFSDQNDMTLENVHLVGHSLGGQMSGFIGKHTMRRCNRKIGRITGLDPAGPLFFGSEESKRLCKTDASFVDIIHTNGGEFGYLTNCGDADFYVNCGSVQPNCLVPHLSLEGILNLPISAVACNHLRALDYMAQSVMTDYKGLPCETCPIGCIPPLKNIFAGKSPKMGDKCMPNVRGSYLVPILKLTNAIDKNI